MSTDRGMIIFGASRGAGLELAKLARGQGWRVVAMLREGRDPAPLQALGVEVVAGDAFEADQVAAAYAAAKGCDVAVSTLGGHPNIERRPDFEANKVVIDAAKQAGIARFLLVTTVGAGDSFDAMPPQARAVLGEAAAAKTKAEEHLRASGLSYTILRPGHLLDDAATGDGVLAEDAKMIGAIPRAELAVLILRALATDATLGKTLSAASAAKIMARGESTDVPLPAL